MAEEIKKEGTVAKIVQLLAALVIGASIVLGVDITKEKNMVDISDAIPVILQDGTEVYAVIVKKDAPKPEAKPEVKAEVEDVVNSD